jgi:hypothetical protein
VLARVRFPVSVLEAAPAADLIDDTEALLKSFADFGGYGARCAALFIMSTWFADLIPAPLTLVLVSSTPAAGAAIFLTFGALTRRSLTASAASAPYFAHCSSKLGGTLLVDATSVGAKGLRWACGVNNSTVVELIHGQVGDRSCPRILLATDALPIADAIQIPILPGRVAGVPSRAHLAEISRRYGSAFAGYRIHYLEQFEHPQSALAADCKGVGIVERTFASCIFDDETLRASVRPLVTRQLGFLANFRSRDDLSILAEVLITFVHDNRQTVAVQEITERIGLLTTLRAESEAGAIISVGRMLSNLGINRAHTKKRNIVVLDAYNNCAIHQAAWIKGVLTGDNLGNCEYCRWISGNEGLGVIGDDGGEEGEKSEEISE